MDTLSERIQSRADKMEENGADVSEAESFLAEAQLELEAATADLSEIQVVVDADVTLTASSTPATVFADVRALLTSAREHTRNAYEALKNAVQSLRKIAVDVKTDTENE